MEIDGIRSEIFQQYEIIRKTGQTNMFNLNHVIRIAECLDLTALLEFIDENNSNYGKIMRNYSAAKKAGIFGE